MQSSLLSKTSPDRLLMASSYLFASSIVGGVLGYVYQIVMARFMTPNDYGLFMALMALVPILSVPLATIYMAVSRRFSQYIALDEKDKLVDLFWSAQIKVVLFGSIGLLFFIACSVSLQRFLVAPSLLSIWLVGIYMFFVFLITIANAAIQANQHFWFIAFSNVIGPLGKLVFGVLFIALGLRVQGAMYGLISTVAMLAAIGFYYCWRNLGLTWRKPSWSQHLNLKDIYPVFLATFSFTLLFQIDLLLVKHLFSPYEAGMYAAAATLGKATLFLPSSIVVPLFPMTAAETTAGRETTNLLLKAIGVTFGISLLGALFYYLLAEQTIMILFGPDYVEAAPILRYYGFAMVPMAIIMVVEHYLVAKGRLLFAYLIFGLSPVFVLFVLFWSHSPISVVWLMIGVGISILVLAVFFSLKPNLKFLVK